MFEKYRIKPTEYVEVPSPNVKERVYITEDGQILSLVRGPLTTGYDCDGNQVIKLDLWQGEKFYLVSLLTLVTFGKLRLQPQYFDLVEPFHIDRDKNNLHPSNLGYRYKRPIECEVMEGYYYIPFFNNYVINRAGEVKNWKSGKTISTYVYKTPKENKANVKGGYHSLSLYSDAGSHSIGRYRLLALTFIPYPDNVDSLTVNHKDGDPTNDAIDNLEWCSYSDNVKHAFKEGMRTQNIPTYGKNVLTGESRKFFSCQEASRFTGVNVHTITQRITETEQKICSGGWLFKKDPDINWREVTDPEYELRRLPTPTKVLSKNVFTGEVRVHESINQVGVDLNLESVSAPRMQLIKGYNRPYCGYLFKTVQDKTPWPEFTERELAVFRDNPTGHARGVIAKNEHGEELFFTNIKKASAHFQHILKTKNDVIKAIARKRNVDGYRLTYLTV